MGISKAREHEVTDPAAYADRSDVLMYLEGVCKDEEGDALEAWASSTNISSAIDRWLVTARKQIDRWAGIDFVLHEDVDIVVDGMGQQHLPLGQYGFRPLIDMTALTIEDGTAADVTDYVLDEWVGMVRPDYDFLGYTLFPRGNLNIALTISWGYDGPPDDIVDANAMLTAARMLPLVGASDLAQPGALGGIQVLEFGEVTVRQYEQGRYSPLIKQYNEEALRIAKDYKIPRISQGRVRVYENYGSSRHKHYYSE